MNAITIHTDGTWHHLLKLGGWAAIKIDGVQAWKRSGGAQDTTKNRMGLRSVIEAVRDAEPGVKTTVLLDSEYVVKGFNGWRHGWEAKGWKTSSGEVVSNLDLWKELIAVTSTLDVQLVWEGCYRQNVVNALCDRLANEEIRKLRRTAGHDANAGEHTAWQPLTAEELARVSAATGCRSPVLQNAP